MGEVQIEAAGEGPFTVPVSLEVQGWTVLKDKTGRRRAWIWERYPQSRWRNLDMETYLLAPGPEGPVGTAHLEWLREGLQQCEARISIEAALTDEGRRARLGAELARKAQETLDQRIYSMWKGSSNLQLTGRWYCSSKEYAKYRIGGAAGHSWYLSSGWQQRTGELYRLAGEVEKAVGGT